MAFKFKQFDIADENSAMKLGSDSVILGAWTNLNCALKALDIGAGCGIISLMLAQRKGNLVIDAVEIDSNAMIDLRKNFGNSKWSDRINIYEADILSYDNESKYDLIVSNPPYFVDSLKSVNNSRNTARHNVNLNYRDLLNKAWSMLSEKGIISIIIPYGQLSEIEDLLNEMPLHINRLCKLSYSKDKNAKRVLLELSASDYKVSKSYLYIKNGDEYSDEYLKLVKDFYLFL